MNLNQILFEIFYNTLKLICPKNNLKLVCLVAIIMFVNACQQDLNISINSNDKRLLVNGEFTTDSIIHSIKLYCSGSLISGQAQIVISGAKIYVTDKKDTFYYKESETPGHYKTTTKCSGIGGHTYYLSISNIDVDKDGKLDEFSAQATMPVPIKIDSLRSVRALHPNDKTWGINNYAYFRICYHGPEYIYKFLLVSNKDNYGTLTDRLGSGELEQMATELKLPIVDTPEKELKRSAFLQAKPNVSNGDTLSFVTYNLTANQFKFLREFDNNTIGDQMMDNIYDKLRIPTG
jgi:hypothetical protein